MPSYKLALTVVILLSSVLFAFSKNDDPVKKFFKTAIGSVPSLQLKRRSRSEQHSFESAISIDGAGWLVEFYAPWCGHCQRLRPLYESVAKEIQSLEDVKVGVAKVDATVEKALASRFPLKGYPTIYFIKDGAVRLYQGSRNVRDFVDFASKGYKKADKLSALESPLGAVGRAKGLVIMCGVYVAELYDDLVDINGYNFEPWQAIAIICSVGMIATFALGLFIAWLFNLTDPTYTPTWTKTCSMLMNYGRKARKFLGASIVCVKS